MLDAIFWFRAAGVRWRHLDSRFGPRQTVHAYVTRWRRDGVLARVVEALQVDLDERGLIDWGLWCVDGSNVRAGGRAGGQGRGRGRKKKSRPRAGGAGRPRPRPQQGWLRHQVPPGH